mgnify:CR=1 FL=1
MRCDSTLGMPQLPQMVYRLLRSPRRPDEHRAAALLSPRPHAVAIGQVVPPGVDLHGLHLDRDAAPMRPSKLALSRHSTCEVSCHISDHPPAGGQRPKDPPYSYEWRKDGIVVGTGSTYSTGGYGGGFTLSVEVTDAKSDTDTDSMVVTTSMFAEECG